MRAALIVLAIAMVTTAAIAETMDPQLPDRSQF
jgi:hypothetical protein